MTKNADGTELVPVRDEYNKIFERLVDASGSGSPLNGHVAYVLYKIAKREWIKDHIDVHGERPNSERVKQFNATYTESRLLGLRTEANQILAEFASVIIEEETPLILKNALKERNFWRDAGIAFVGALFYTVFLIACALLLKFTDIDAIGIFEKLGVSKAQHSGILVAPTEREH